MGYNCTCRETKFKLPCENIGKAIEPIVQSNYFDLSQSAEDCLNIARTGTEEEKRQLLYELLDDNGWTPSFDDEGNVDAFTYQNEKWYDDYQFFDVFAKYVEKGSYIEMGGEDGASWRMLFDGEHCKEVEPVIAWPDCEQIQKELAAEKAPNMDADILLKPLGNSMFISWAELSVAFHGWATAYFGSHVHGGANRDETDVEIALVGLKSSDRKKFVKLFEVYDKDNDFDAKEEFCTGQQLATLPNCVALGVLGELLQETKFGPVGHFTATYDGVFVTEKALSWDDICSGEGFVSVGYSLPSKSPLDKQIESARSRSAEDSISPSAQERNSLSTR